MTVHVLGIRHHGPGSARSVERALHALQPDCVLIEGPPELTEIVKFAGHAEMIPPIAGFVFATDRPELSVFDPFASFSPEWIALRYALKHGLPIRFIDLPATHELAKRAEVIRQLEAASSESATSPEADSKSSPGQAVIVSGEDSKHTEEANSLDSGVVPKTSADGPAEDSGVQLDSLTRLEELKNAEEDAERRADGGLSTLEAMPAEVGLTGPSLGTRARLDPIGTLAELAGVGDAERWWEDVVEHQVRAQSNPSETEFSTDQDPVVEALRPFAAIGEAMRDLRAAADSESDGSSFYDTEREAQREASMRQRMASSQLLLCVELGMRRCWNGTRFRRQHRMRQFSRVFQRSRFR
jgi:Family of unknown function (DUF5682)